MEYRCGPRCPGGVGGHGGRNPHPDFRQPVSRLALAGASGSSYTFLAFYRTARRVPTPYQVAQFVDERLSLRDTLSTALYFSAGGEEAGRPQVSESVRLAQLAESDRVGRQRD